MKVAELMTKGAATCRTEDSLNEVARIFWDCDTGCLPVVDDEAHVIGMITDRDVCLAAFFRGSSLHQIGVADVMSRHVLFCRPGDPIEDALETMRTHQVRRLPVVDGEGRLQGLLSIVDAVRVAAKGGDLKAKKVVRTAAAITERRLAKDAAPRTIEMQVEIQPAPGHEKKRARTNGRGKPAKANSKPAAKSKKKPARRRPV